MVVKIAIQRNSVLALLAVPLLLLSGCAQIEQNRSFEADLREVVEESGLQDLVKVSGGCQGSLPFTVGDCKVSATFIGSDLSDMAKLEQLYDPINEVSERHSPAEDGYWGWGGTVSANVNGVEYREVPYNSADLIVKFDAMKIDSVTEAQVHEGWLSVRTDKAIDTSFMELCDAVELWSKDFEQSQVSGESNGVRHQIAPFKQPKPPHFDSVCAVVDEAIASSEGIIERIVYQPQGSMAQSTERLLVTKTKKASMGEVKAMFTELVGLITVDFYDQL